MHSRLNTVIVGAGSIGSFLGGSLAAGKKADVSFVGRDPHMSVVRENGLILELLDRTETVKIEAFTHVKQVRQKPDLVVMTVRADQTDEALMLLREELEQYVKEGPTKDELEASISNITGGFALNLDSNSKLVSNLAMIGFYDLPLDYLETYVENMKGVSRSDVKKVLKKRLDTSKLVTVIVGDSSGLQSAGK